jgi:hypothetical protein
MPSEVALESQTQRYLYSVRTCRNTRHKSVQENIYRAVNAKSSFHMLTPALNHLHSKVNKPTKKHMCSHRRVRFVSSAVVERDNPDVLDCSTVLGGIE